MLAINLYPIMTDDDIEFIRKTRNANKHYFLTIRYISKEAHKKWFKTFQIPEKRQLYIIYVQGERGGMISVTKKEKSLELGHVVILSKYRRQGVLKEVLFRIIGLYGVPQLELDVRVDNAKAIVAYEKLGFKQVSIHMKK